MKNKFNKIILTDVDGCLLNWDGAFHKWMQSKGRKPSKDYKKIYSLEVMYDVDYNDMDKLVREFNSSADMGFLEPLRDAKTYVKKLHDKHGYKFHALTSMGDDEAAHKLRVMNLDNVFGPKVFTEIRFLPLHAPKDKLLLEYHDKGFRGVWIEDRVSNARKGTELGFKSLVMEHGYNMNENDDMFQFVRSWKEIYEFVLAHS